MKKKKKKKRVARLRHKIGYFPEILIQLTKRKFDFLGDFNAKFGFALSLNPQKVYKSSFSRFTTEKPFKRAIAAKTWDKIGVFSRIV